MNVRKWRDWILSLRLKAEQTEEWSRGSGQDRNRVHRKNIQEASMPKD